MDSAAETLVQGALATGTVAHIANAASQSAAQTLGMRVPGVT